MSFPSTAATSKRTARRRLKKGEFAQAIGRSRGGRTSKIHPLADDRGRPVAFALTPGNVADITMAIVLAPWTSPSAYLPIRPMMPTVWGHWLKRRKIKAVIPINRHPTAPIPA